MILTNKKDITRLSILFTLTYMVSYITRINYGAIISEMEASTDFPRNLLSMALTGSFITYGVGQVISGILGDKISPKKLVSIGYILTIVMNLLIPICQNPYQMLGVWCVNGFAQSFMWPPLVKLMTAYLSDDDYKKVSVRISWGSSFGTIFIYLFAPLLIIVGGWRSVFLFSAAAGLIMLLVWNRHAVDFVPEKQTKQGNDNQKNKNLAVIFSPVMICVMICIILQGMLRDGVTTWMPTYISDTYNLSSVISILTGVVLPLFSIFSFNMASKLYRSVFKNTVFCAGVIFFAGAVCALALYLLTGFNAIFSVIFSALLSGCMHGVNLILICMVPHHFKKYGNVSTVSGIINSCTYIGSAISTYSIALLSEKLGWTFTLKTWLIVAIVGTALCFLVSKPWKKQYQSE
ncbi:MAG: MFS transporter [Ruminococcaceae bacterium]|nr:MFS transporter [Oscillospiraceae bacterium]